MKTSIKFPADFYEQLYDKIMDYGFEPDNEDDTSCSMEIEIGKFTINLTATFEVQVVDNSFDHAFGTEYIYDLEAGDLEEIEIEGIWFYDEDDNEIEVSDQFDEKCFWEQFKVYGTKSKGVQIHHGDEVVVKSNFRFGSWKKMIYLYTDKRLGVHVCCRRFGKYPCKNNYQCILPATTAALAIVGKNNYYLSHQV
jgi:hypothetical protein